MSVDISTSRDAQVGGVPVRRALPRRARRTVGAWCFVDHFGPVGPDRSDAMQVGPHPHLGLHTVTWLLEGEVLHADSLGSEQLIRPGQVNLMTAGGGVAHAESARSGTSGLHGVQLWVAQPEATRHGAPAFEHHPELPRVELDAAVVTVLMGSLGDARSPARHDTPLLGADLELHGGDVVLPLDPAWEHALVVTDGAVEVAGQALKPGELAYLAPGVDELAVRSPGPSRALLLGGQPFGEQVLMWWNFVARTRQEVEQARSEWESGDERFGAVPTLLDRIPAPGLPWAT